MSSPYQVLVREQSPEWRGTASALDPPSGSAYKLE